MNPPLDRLCRKTEAGSAALATRSAALPARARTALILINGREPMAVLAHKIGADAPALVEMLLAMGLIEDVPPPAAPLRPKPVPPPSPVAVPVADDTVTAARLAQLKRDGLHLLAPQFGPDVDVICRPLLEANTAAHYNAALAGIESKLAIYLGRKQALRLLDPLRL
ncbi:MAG: hypothetical protein C0505_08715 [Leptothrix sp. (in: Bacteria)]|nr:hypothetical protein [Leptothrix sp. (in: b-proteobacteria)]